MAQEETLPPWLEVSVESDRPILMLREQLEAVIGEHPTQLLAVKLDRGQATVVQEKLPLPELSTLSVEEVFDLCCQEKAGITNEQQAELKDTFLALRNWLQEQEVE